MQNTHRWTRGTRIFAHKRITYNTLKYGRLLPEHRYNAKHLILTKGTLKPCSGEKDQWLFHVAGSGSYHDDLLNSGNSLIKLVLEALLYNLFSD